MHLPEGLSLTGSLCVSSFTICPFLGAKETMSTMSMLTNGDEHITYMILSGGRASNSGLPATTVLMRLVRMASDEAMWLLLGEED